MRSQAPIRCQPATCEYCVTRPRHVPAMAPVGRPTAFTPETRASVLESLRGCHTYKSAAERAGIDYSTLKRWLADGRSDYCAFRAECEKAEAECLERLLRSIEAAALKSWQAAAWLIERRYLEWRMPKDQPGSAAETLGALTDEELRRRLADVRARLLAAPTPEAPTTSAKDAA